MRQLKFRSTMDPDAKDVVFGEEHVAAASIQRHSDREPRVVVYGLGSSFTLSEFEEIGRELRKFSTRVP